MARNPSKSMALGGVMAALAVVIMCLGGIIPIATYICPVLCSMLLAVVLSFTGKRIAWTWYVAVSLLSLLLGPDKEAAAVFLFLGYYPIVKPWLDRRKLSAVWKLLLFNGMILSLYTLLIYLFKMEQVVSEFQQMGMAVTLLTLLMGNVVLFMLDMLLARLNRRIC